MRLLDRLLARASPWVVAPALAVAVAAVAIDSAGSRSPTRLDSEHSAPAYLSGAIVAAAALVAWRLGHATASRAHLAFAVLLLYVAVDEVLAVHERVEETLGVDWQVVYAPVALLGAVCGAVVALGMRHRPAALGVLAAGATAWAASQVIEALQWDGSVLVAPETVVYEEVLELTGSALILLALLSAFQLHRLPVGTSTAQADPAGAPATRARRRGRRRGPPRSART